MAISKTAWKWREAKKGRGKFVPLDPFSTLFMTLQHPHCTCIFPDDSVESGVAHFSGHSWISLPTLTHAYSDLQLSFEFKPEAEDGILLLTGETRDMTGDYLALLLRQGHVELRYN